MVENGITRKEFLQRLLLLGVTAVGAGGWLLGCGKKEEAAETAERPPAGTTSRPQTTPADPCADLSGLTQAELKMRETLRYVAVSPEPDKLCDNCKFWTPAEAGEPCGGCQLIKGPIHPKGYCTSWFVQDT